MASVEVFILLLLSVTHVAWDSSPTSGKQVAPDYRRHLDRARKHGAQRCMWLVKSNTRGWCRYYDPGAT